MNSLRGLIIGTVVGTIVGVLSLAIAYAGLSISGAPAAFPMVIVVSAVVGSAAAGSSGVILSCLLTSLERSVTTTLIALAVAALILLPGDYANSSLLPAFVYATAVANGLIIARAVGPFCYQPSGSAEHLLS